MWVVEESRGGCPGGMLSSHGCEKTERYLKRLPLYRAEAWGEYKGSHEGGISGKEGVTSEGLDQESRELGPPGLPAHPPGLPWYVLRRKRRSNGDRSGDQQAGVCLTTYLTWLFRCLHPTACRIPGWSPDPVVHPDGPKVRRNPPQAATASDRSNLPLSSPPLRYPLPFPSCSYPIPSASNMPCICILTCTTPRSSYRQSIINLYY